MALLPPELADEIRRTVEGLVAFRLTEEQWDRAGAILQELMAAADQVDVDRVEVLHARLTALGAPPPPEAAPAPAPAPGRAAPAAVLRAAPGRRWRLFGRRERAAPAAPTPAAYVPPPAPSRMPAPAQLRELANRTIHSLDPFA